MLDHNCSFQKCRWFTKTANLINLSIYLFCLLFWEFISLSVRRLCFLRNFHTVLPSYCTRLHSLQPFRRFPDLQASSVFMILLVGFLLVVILTVRWCITVLFYISCYLAMLSISFASCPSKGRSCPPPPPPTQPQQLRRTVFVSPERVEYSWTRDEARRPFTVRWVPKHCVMSGFSSFFWDEYIYFLEYNCFTMLC